jgi:hypothetical protein
LSEPPVLDAKDNGLIRGRGRRDKEEEMTNQWIPISSATKRESPIPIGARKVARCFFTRQSRERLISFTLGTTTAKIGTYLSSKQEDSQDEHARQEGLDEDALSEVDAGSERRLDLEIARDKGFDEGGSCYRGGGDDMMS